MAETKMNYIKYDHILKQDVASYSDWETALKCCYGNPRYSIRQEVFNMSCGCVSEMGESCESCVSDKEKQASNEYAMLQSLNRTLWVFDELRRISGQLHRLDEGDCNGRTEQGEKYSETREKNLMASAQSWTDKLNLGLIAYHQGAPRGCALYLSTPAIKKSGQYPNGVAITSKPNYD